MLDGQQLSPRGLWICGVGFRPIYFLEHFKHVSPSFVRSVNAPLSSFILH